jgi:hypothetical protein
MVKNSRDQSCLPEPTTDSRCCKGCAKAEGWTGRCIRIAARSESANGRPSSEFIWNGVILLDPDTLPEDIRRVAGDYNLVLISDDLTEEKISLQHGGGFYHWSIIVGRPGHIPYNPNQYDQIADGVWGWRE